MLSRLPHAACIVLSALAVSACATRASVTDARREVEALADEVRLLRTLGESNARQVARLGADLRAAESQLAALGPQLAAEAANLRWLGERVEEVSREVKHATPGRPAATPEPPGSGPAAVRDLAAKPGTAPPADRAAPRRDSAEQLYGAALEVLRAGQHGQAVLEFLGFLRQYPDHALAGRAHYWIGEAYFAQGDYRQALAQYRKVTQNFEGSPADPDALLKAGVCYAKLNDPARAREAWQQVVRQYPRSAAAEKARDYIRTRPASTRRQG
jgi:tol-pal system protein YbgF